MTIINYLEQQFVEEGTITRKMLSRIPDSAWNFKPHEKSMVMSALATHLADLPGWIHMAITSDELDFATNPEQAPLNNSKELMDYFEKRYQGGLSQLVAENEAVLGKTWTLRNGETIYWQAPKLEILRTSMSQQIHHRAQLGVYLRLLNIPIPGSYGPSADENDFM